VPGRNCMPIPLPEISDVIRTGAGNQPPERKTT
jgi:hypothetical protein